MLTRLGRIAAVSAFLVVPVCAFGQSAADARKAYDAMVRDIERVVLAGDAAGITRLYTDDATVVEEDGSVSHGRAAIGLQVREEFKTMSIKTFKLTTTEFESHGPLAWAAGTETFTATDKATGKELRDAVHFLVVLRQQPDKRWLTRYDIEAPMKGKP